MPCCCRTYASSCNVCVGYRHEAMQRAADAFHAFDPDDEGVSSLDQ